MKIETFDTLIAKNKRNSFLLIGGFMVFFVAVGLLIGVVWGSGSDEFGQYYVNWYFGVIVAVIAAVVAFFLTLASYYGGSGALMAMSKAHEIKKSDDPQLFNVVEEMAIAGGVPLPRIFLIQDSAMNAFASGRNPQHACVAITTGLREKLSRDELQGVMAHEMSHVRHYDILYAMLMAVMVGCLVMLCDVFLRSMFWGSIMGGRRRRRDSSGGGAAQIVMVVVALVLAIIAPILARIIQMSLSRQREFLADAGAAELTRNPEGLASALKKLSGQTEVLEVANRATAPLYIVNPIMKAKADGSRGSVFDTHPPTKDRINRLRSLTS